MKKALLSIGVICLAGVAQVSAKQNGSKSYFAARNELQREDMHWVLGQPHRLNRRNAGPWGMTLDVDLFHSSSTNKEGLGQYFGASANADFSDANGTVKIVLDETKDTNALYGRNIDHTSNQDNTEAPMYGTLNFSPKQVRTGAIVRADWHLGKLMAPLKRWHVAITVPVVRVTNSLGLTITADGPSTTDTNKTEGGTLAEFFAGTYEQTLTANKQLKLTHGRVTTADREQTGVADLKCSVGYNFITKKDSAIEFGASLILPLGNKSTAVDLFEAVHGNNGHTGVSLTGNATMRVTQNKKKKSAWWLSALAEYTFLFQAREKRLAGLHDNANDKVWSWGQYAVGIERFKGGGVFPLANVLARDMYVSPGSHFEGSYGLTWVKNNLHVNVGYSMFYRQTETAKLIDWPVERYGAALFTFDAGDAGVLHGGDAAGPIQAPNMTTTNIDGATVLYQADPTVCAAPDTTTQSLLCGMGYAGRFGCMKYAVRAGASYELAGADSKAMSQYAVFGGITLSW